MRASMARSSLLAVIAGLFISTFAQAGALNGHPSAFSSGSTPFDNGGTLKGFVDWAVFNPGAFPGAYSGYTPTSGELAYAYQIFVTGAAPVSSFELVLMEPADNIGSFSQLGGTAPSSQVLNPLTSAKWTYPGIATGGSSYGMAFSSPRIPQNLFATVVDTGQTTFVIPLPSPSSQGIPEPATFGLAAMGCLVFGLRRRR